VRSPRMKVVRCVPAACPPQVLPVNDTCVYNMWWDSYPYSSVSVHALHPQYLALRATLDDLQGVTMPADIAAAIEAARVSRCPRLLLCMLCTAAELGALGYCWCELCGSRHLRLLCAQVGAQCAQHGA
jgi:hypothetical protein